ncbi:type IV secretory system conjugative DNA transfer family protein [Clostridium boliviensis]|uniref:Type IV secretory system conjugative DNA transfer family protein n=1 Tax=Clostridium boliviensis TaxID=318465 RepID=A0ABU4GLV9_9CLOT|nr:type IV secretory system conjugative DNA transfer family protein [Clostridium boliviensis]MDW2797992.1 type IV secretory system conjugative DNA transfer family protein [Clostridium boliviensis]
MATLNKTTMQEKKLKRLRAIIGVTVVELLISPLIAYVIHQYTDWLFHITKYDGLKLDYSYLNAWIFLIKNTGVKLWFLIIQALYASYIIWLVIRPKAEIMDVKEIEVTDKIKIPVAVGNGQYGNARFLTDKEKDTIFSTFVFTGKEVPDGNGGLVIEMKKDAKGRELIRYIQGEGHALILGATGAGKTRRSLLITVWLQLITGLCIVVSDVKGEIYAYTHKFAKSLGYKPIAVDFRNPKKSAHYNFLQPILDALAAKDKAKAIDYTWDLVSVLVGEQKGEPLWYNGETATIAAAILAVSMEAEEQYRNLTNVYFFLAYMCQPHPVTFKTPLSLYLSTLPDGHPAKSVFAMAQVAHDRTKSSFYTSAMGTLKLFTNPNVAEMTSKSDFRLSDIGKEKVAFYMLIPDEKKTLYPLASILINQIYIAQVETASQNGLSLPIETDYDLDEVGNFPYIPILGGLLSAGRSRGCRANLYIQDYQQLESKYKDEFRTIKTCCETKIVLKADDPDTLKAFSESLGDYTVEVPSASTSTSTSSKSNDVNISNSSSMTGRKLLKSEEIGRIDYPYALSKKLGEYAAITELPDLGQYRINKIWGLGDKKTNKRILIEREQEREERIVEDIPLWGVWNKYKEMLEEEAAQQISFLS